MEFAQNGRNKQETILAKRVAKGKLTEEEKNAILERVTVTADNHDLADCDLIIEAVLENVDVKQGVFRELDQICKPETIFASNTSAISITKLASAVQKGRAFVGTHFNSPASVMKLVEVVSGNQTTKETADIVYDLLASIGKEPIRVKDVVGFALNRMFHIFYGEAMRLVEEGVCSPEDVDSAVFTGLDTLWASAGCWTSWAMISTSALTRSCLMPMATASAPVRYCRDLWIPANSGAGPERASTSTIRNDRKS